MITSLHSNFSQGASGADSQLAAPLHGAAGHQPADKAGDSALRASGPASLGVAMPARIFRAFVPLWLRFLEDVARHAGYVKCIVIAQSFGATGWPRYESLGLVRSDALEAFMRGLAASGLYESVQAYTVKGRRNEYDRLQFIWGKQWGEKWGTIQRVTQSAEGRDVWTPIARIPAC